MNQFSPARIVRHVTTSASASVRSPSYATRYRLPPASVSTPAISPSQRSRPFTPSHAHAPAHSPDPGASAGGHPAVTFTSVRFHPAGTPLPSLHLTHIRGPPRSAPHDAVTVERRAIRWVAIRAIAVLTALPTAGVAQHPAVAEAADCLQSSNMPSKRWPQLNAITPLLLILSSSHSPS